MSYEWGRAPEAGKWQRAAPVWFMSVILLALAQRHRRLVGPSDIRLDTAAAALSVGVRPQRPGQFAGHSDRPLSPPPDREPPREPPSD
jgi:hypothetical protein